MATDPFTALLDSLQSLFHLEAMRNGKYTFAEIQRLKEATDEYDHDNTASFIKLLQALKGSLPHLEKWNVDFNTIRMNLDVLAQQQNLKVNWTIFLQHPRVSHKFQFSAQNQSRELELIPWIAFKTEKPFAKLNQTELTQFLLDHSETLGFSQRLANHLKKDPGFLFRLSMSSAPNFIKIAESRLSLFLTDVQIATAIVQHSPELVKPHINPLIEVELYIQSLNGILSKGRSVAGLMRNTEAKSILDRSKYFQIYQSEDYKNRHAPHPRHSGRNPPGVG